MSTLSLDRRRAPRPVPAPVAAVARLRRNADVRAVFQAPHRVHGRAVVVQARARPDLPGPARVAVVAGRKVGGAVQRNRAKRRLRALLAQADLPAGLDFVVVARAAANQMSAPELAAELGRLTRTVASHAGGGAP